MSNKTFLTGELSEIIPLHTINRLKNSSLSHPVWNLKGRKTKDWKFVEFHINVPPIQTITKHNNFIILNNKKYEIDQGFDYKNNENIIEAFNNKISEDGFTISIDQTTNLITITNNTIFTIEKNDYLGFPLCSGNKTYTSIKGFDINEGLIFICSDFSSYLQSTSMTCEKETWLPNDLLFSTIHPVINSFYPISSNLFKIRNNFEELRQITFSFRTPSRPHDDIIITNNWSVLIKVFT